MINGTKYPSQYETEVVLRDGSLILLRPITCDDIEAWVAFVSRLSERTKYLRFFHVPKEMGREDALRFCTVDYKNTFAYVAEVLKERRRNIVAIGRYYRLPNKNSAEVAFAIDDAYQGKGLGTKLIECLATVALDNGITAFEGDTMTENVQMLDILRGYGFHVSFELEEDL